jgi:hypothetical protein
LDRCERCGKAPSLTVPAAAKIMAARQSPELVGKLGKLFIIALIAALLMAVVVRDPVGVWHFAEAVITLGLRLLNAVVVLIISLISGISH